MEKVLVTGGCGFIGSNLTNRLIKLGYNVDVIDNLFIGKEAKIPEGKWGKIIHDKERQKI